MKFMMCSIYDAAVGTYSPPFFARAMGIAFRDFRHALVDPKSSMSKAPSDFSLFVLGEFDDESCKLMLLDAPRRAMTGPEAVASVKGESNEG